MSFFKKKKAILASIFVIMFSLISVIGLRLVNAAGNIPSLTIEYAGTNIGNQTTTATTINGKLNEEIEVKYKVTPQDIPVSTINGSNNKEIVLVLDTSGSMTEIISEADKTIRIDALKTAAKNFINNFSGVDNVKIGIASYSTTANYNNLSLPLTSTKNGNSTLISKIDSYQKEDIYSYYRKISSKNIEGGTNTGDGIRYALNMLNNGSDAKKFVILMSDGKPTYYTKKLLSTPKQVWHDGYYSEEQVWHDGYYTIENVWHRYGGYYRDYVWHKGYYTTEQVWHDGYYSTEYYEYYTDLDNNYNEDNVGGPGNSDDDKQNCLRYASTMAEKIKEAGYFSYNIAYSDGSSADNMKSLATASGGKFYSALDANAINSVFSEIGNQIKETYTVENVKLNYSIPDGIEYTGNMAGVTINGNQYTQILPNIVYRLNKDKTMYTADYFYITFKLRANKTGSFSFPQGLILTYNGLGGNLVTINNAIQPITFNVTDAVPNITAKISDQTPQLPNPASIADNVTLNYKVNADPFSFYSEPVYQADPKDVVFVVDTSTGMSDSQLTTIKNGLFGQVVNNSLVQNAKYGIVSFNSTVKDDYILGGLTNNITTLDSAIKSISMPGNSGRDIGNAMEHAKTIFLNYGRTDSAKYLVLIATGDVTYTPEQLADITNGNYKIITLNLGYITPPSKVNDVVIPGAVEPNNNIKTLHYSLIGKQDNEDNILQKADNNYFLNIDYRNVTNTNNPNEFFTIFENSQNMNNQNVDVNSVLPKVAIKIENGVLPMQQQTYTFNAKLKFKTQGKFDIISGLNTSTDTNYDVETSSFDVNYIFDATSGQYVLDTSKPIADRVLTIKIKNGVDPSNLQFGPGIVSYVGFYNTPLSTNIDPYLLKLKTIQIQNFGVYKGILDNKPNILESSQPINLERGSSLSLGATLIGALNNNTDIKLDIQNGFVLNGGINVYSYDDSGNLTKVGTMIQSTSDTTKATYKYSGQTVVNNKILILYEESFSVNSDKNNIYINNLYTSDQSKNVQIKMIETLQIKDFGLYKGISNNEPNILVSDQPFNIRNGTNVRLGATLTGSINNNTNVKLAIQNGITLNGDINVYLYDDSGNLTKIGNMVQSASDSSKTTYKYSGQDVLNKKILIVYNEYIDNSANLDSAYSNTLYTPDGNNRNVQIKITDEFPELF